MASPPGSEDALLTPDTSANQCETFVESQQPMKNMENQLMESSEDENIDPNAQFSAQQLRARVEMARFQSRKQAHESYEMQLQEMNGRINDMQLQMDFVNRQNEFLQKTNATFQEALESIRAAHDKTLAGMSDHLNVEELVSSLEVEKSLRQTLAESFQRQNAKLMEAQERIQNLNKQVADYQKNETVLAECISHFQHRATSRDRQQVGLLAKKEQELQRLHDQQLQQKQQEISQLEQNNAILKQQLLQTEQILVEKTRELEQTRQLVDQQSHESDSWRERILSLETEKEVLEAKISQLERTEVLLRNDLNGATQQIHLLTNEKDELSQIATNAMEMLEAQSQQRHAPS